MFGVNAGERTCQGGLRESTLASVEGNVNILPEHVFYRQGVFHPFLIFHTFLWLENDNSTNMDRETNQHHCTSTGLE